MKFKKKRGTYEVPRVQRRLPAERNRGSVDVSADSFMPSVVNSNSVMIPDQPPPECQTVDSSEIRLHDSNLHAVGLLSAMASKFGGPTLDDFNKAYSLNSLEDDNSIFKHK